MQIQEKICLHCQQPYIPKRADAKYCSQSCKQLSYLNRKNESRNDAVEDTDSEESLETQETDAAVKCEQISENSEHPTEKSSVKISVKPQQYKPYRSSVNIRQLVNDKGFFRMKSRSSVRKSLLKTSPHSDTRETESSKINESNPGQENLKKATHEKIEQQENTSSTPINSGQGNSKQTELKKQTYMEEKEDEWIEKRIGGLDMATMITKWESSYEGHVTRTNKQLRQWLKKIISLSNRREVKVREIRELLTSIKTFQQSYDYKHLPCDYPYFLFIEEIKDKIKKSIISFELEGVESAKLFLSEKAQADITYTLLDIEQE